MPSYSTRGSDYYSAIELAVQTTGIGALNDLEAAFRGNGQALTALQGMYASGAIKLDEYREETAKLKREQAELTEAIAAANRVMAGQPAMIRQASTAMQGWSNAALQASRAAEDFAVTGGSFAAILNNLPGVANGVGRAMGLAAPQVALLESAVSAVGIGVLVATPAIKAAAKAIDEIGNVSVPAGTQVEELKKRADSLEKSLEAMQKRGSLKWWEADEYRKAQTDLENINKELEKQRDLKNLLDGKSKGQREAASSFQEAVSEVGGGNAIQTLISALYDQKRDPLGRVFDPTTRQQAFPEKVASNLLVDAGKGDTYARDEIVRLLGPNSQFGKKITELSPETKARKEKEEKDKKDAEDRDQQVARDAASEGDAAADEVKALSQRFRAGFIDVLERDLFDTLKSLPPGDRLEAAKRFGEAREKALAGQVAAQTGLDPGDFRNTAVARKYLEDATAGALNAITANDPPKLVKERERDQAREVDETVKRLAPGVADLVEKAILTREARGATPEDAAAGVLPSLRDWVEKQGVTGDKLDKVSRAILDKGSVAVGQDLAKLGNVPLQQAAQQQLLTVLDKIDAKLSSDQRRAAGNEANRQVQAFANAYQGMTGESNARSLDAGRRAAKWFGDGYTEDEALQAAMMEMAEMGVERGERRDQLGRGGHPADRRAREAKAAQLKAQRQAKKVRDAEWKARMGPGAGPAPEGNGGGLLSVPPSAPMGDVGGPPNPKAPAPSMGAESALMAANRELSAALGQANARLQRLEQAGLAMANNMRLTRQRLNRNVNQAPALAAPSPFR